jgi:PAS domain-containing protein
VSIDGRRTGSEYITERKRPEETAHRSEKDLCDLIETVPAILWAARRDGSNEFINRGWAEYTGLSVSAGTLQRERPCTYLRSGIGSMVSTEEVALWVGRNGCGEFIRRIEASGKPRWIEQLSKKLVTPWNTSSFFRMEQ